LRLGKEDKKGPRNEARVDMGRAKKERREDESVVLETQKQTKEQKGQERGGVRFKALTCPEPD